eukprot:CAMPEP_0197896818 /NCGR_PEP_ID=MMETSP1439-20131203/40888_1 /TAXON_ID=66791 /ORGANISM="Gonyaulax spinifera, Strain CCMP409" /LENGTH=299 /DNA_ID=CAMNT_0043517389 /DNA_START=54 /DNA_END=953 /DNA_ORIENTATION=+
MAPEKQSPPLWHRFVAGGLGDMTAVLFSHPADVMKVRLQLLGECDKTKRSVTTRDYLRTGRGLLLTEGVVGGLYAGVSASLMRQAFFSGMRHGLYGVLESHLRQSGIRSTASAKLTCAIASGCTGALIANPFDVVLIRMQADGHWPAQQQRGYSHVFNGISRVCREEGVAALWRGCGPTVLRAALVTGSQITTYEEAKTALKHRGWEDGIQTHVVCAAASATIACLTTSPVDVVKTRIMNMQRAHGVSYQGPIDCVWQTMRTEGPLAFYKGLSATFLRLWPHTIVLWIAQEKYSALLRG